MPADLVLLHGFTQTGASWDGVVRELAGRYRALAPDLGAGPWEAFAGYMNAALDAGAGALGAALAGTFTPTPELLAAARDLYAAGGNPEAAAYAGIDTKPRLWSPSC